MNCLEVSSSAWLIHTVRIKHKPRLRARYMNPMRDFGDFAYWIDDNKAFGVKNLIVGVDVKRWLDKIRKL